MPDLPAQPRHLPPARMKKPKNMVAASLHPSPSSPALPAHWEFAPKLPKLTLPPFPSTTEESGSMTNTKFDVTSLMHMLSALPTGDLDSISEALPRTATSWSSEMEVIFGPSDLKCDVLTDVESGYRSGHFPSGRSDAAKERRAIKGFQKETEKKVKEASANTVTFETFSLTNALNSDTHLGAPQITEPLQTWDDDISRIALHLNTMFMALGRVVKLSAGGGADCKGRNVALSYVWRKGELAGVFKIVTGWHAIGHPNDPSILSSDMTQTSSQFSACATLLQELSITSRRINSLIKEVDPSYYSQLEALQSQVLKKYAFAKALKAIDPLLMEGRAIMFNRKTPRHLNHADPPGSWAILFVTGVFTVGYLFIPQLNLRLQYRPGDVVMLRGRELAHEVEAWVGGQRISVAHFTHQSIWDEHGLRLCVLPAP
ncbi:hypothetical protein JAAARDRAFT_44817 [Jaapia argillacea MUCL 33604]|uniref:Uncharacterized protein n=1 Tax=Jaapia argillacea MUCL 33604 TaxID=933084 RepID=A0A067Q604_9AGAM|nr:hypothetical protein JAAARDRAFT_44817 [Jaapia argillacea MUCL 33604]